MDIFGYILRRLTPDGLWYIKPHISATQLAVWQTVSHDSIIYDCKYMHDNHCGIEAALGAGRWLKNAYKVYLVVHLAQHMIFKKDRFSSKAILRLAKNILQTYALVIGCGFMAKMTM